MERGLPAGRCLQGTGLCRDDLDNPEQHVTGEQELTIIGNLLDGLGDPPGFGLEAGVRYHLTTYGIWGFALISSPTFRSAIAVGLRYVELTYSFCRVYTRDDGDVFYLMLDVSTVPPKVRRFLIERDIAAIHVIQREAFAAATRLRRVMFAFPPPPADVL